MLVAQGYTQEEGIDYEEVFAPVARIEAIRLFLAYASFMKFRVYQMDVKSAFLYGTIDEEVYVFQPPGFENPNFPDRVYKLKKALNGLHQAPRAWYDTLSTYLLENGFERGIIDKNLFIKRKKKDILLVQIYVDDIIFGSTKDYMCKEFEELMHKRFKMSSMGELTFFLGLQVKQKKDGIFISQSKYVQDILTKFGFSDSKPASTPMETHKQITVDLEGEDVDVHHYRSMIGSLMYLTTSRPNIMFAVCVCARFQVRPKQSHFQAVKRIFRYLKGQPRLGLWYHHDSPFDLLAYSDSDLGGANLDRKSTSGGCQFLGARIVSWQCKKQTTVSTSTTETKYIAAASCCLQVLWIQNQMLDYGVTFLHTPIFIDNNSAISIVNNQVKHSKTKHIEIRYHFIRDCNEKKLIQVVKVHTSNQFADLFTKAFDIASIGYLVVYTASAKLLLLTLFLLLISVTTAVDFLKSSHIAYALTVNPTIYVEHLRQFWANASIQTVEGNQVIQSRVCDKPISITEDCIHTHLCLDDASGITSLPKEDLFQVLSRMGYEGPTDVDKFYKNRFSPQCRFFVHTLQYCISRKTTGWSEFSSTIAYALVFLATSRKFNFSQMLLNDLLSNLDTKTERFYMYPRFVQEILLKELTDLPSLEEVYVPKPPKGKVFSNMKRHSKEFSGQDTPLFSTIMGVSHSHGEASGSQPTSDHPTDDLPTPFNYINTPQIPIVKPKSPITKTYIRKKVQKVPSLLVSSPPKPTSPIMKHSPSKNIQRETIGVSPNPKKVLYKEKDEHVGRKAHTTVSAQGPRCQETTGVEGASARQKASTKRSKDPSKVVNTPKGGEDRYNYESLMDTLGTLSLEVHNQNLEIKDMQKVILSQQEQIAHLKKLVLKLVHKKKKTKFVLKKMSIVHDASKKGETQATEDEEENPVGMEFQFEGELNTEAEKKQAAETKTTKAAETSMKEAVTESAAETIVKAAVNVAEAETEQEVVTTVVETEKVAAETGMFAEEIEIADTLVKAKTDTPKATQKAKGVVIKEDGSEKKRKEVSETEIKRKGKEKVVEYVKTSKKSSQIALDEELAKKLQEEMEKEEEIQSAKDREIALELSTKLNEEFQRSLKTVAAAKKVTKKASRQRLLLKTRQRQPSKTFLANQERRKMINFLKGAIGVPKGMFINMSFGRIEELYKKEMAKMKGDFTQRVEVERKLKERHDLNIQHPFPDSEEGTPIKEKPEVKQEETLAQKIGAIKRKKSIATKSKAKRPRTEEGKKEQESEKMETESSEQQKQGEQVDKEKESQEQSNQQSNEQFHSYMTLTDEEPVQADPISMHAPEIIHWDTLRDNRREYFRFKRMGDQYEVYPTWGKTVISCTRVDLEEIYKVGLTLYEDVLKGAEMNLIKIAMEYLYMMFDPDRVKHIIRDVDHEKVFRSIDHWMLIERCGVYVLTIDKSYHEYFLVDKVYDHSKAKLQGLLNAKLVCPTSSEMAKIVITRTINQSLVLLVEGLLLLAELLLLGELVLLEDYYCKHVNTAED
ncbi:hypothetical protein L6452_44769 [Arctium lappa]|nr:hypothetical protein L6452_44769 [Arctium lappa]